MSQVKRQEMRRSGLELSSETSSKTSNSHLLQEDYNKSDITPAMSSTSEEGEGGQPKKFNPYPD